jgi:hypothetical protein
MFASIQGLYSPGYFAPLELLAVRLPHPAISSHGGAFYAQQFDEFWASSSLPFLVVRPGLGMTADIIGSYNDGGGWTCGILFILSRATASEPAGSAMRFYITWIPSLRCQTATAENIRKLTTQVKASHVES